MEIENFWLARVMLETLVAIDVSHLNTGFYLLEINSSEKRITKKLSIQ